MRLACYINRKFERKHIEFIFTTLFIAVVTVLAWQSDDAYHGYVMAKNLVEGHGLVYNIGERVNASTCPLFTLVIAFGYLLCRNMYWVSLFICILFSSAAFVIVIKTFCRSISQILIVSVSLMISNCFISYTTSGLENSMLFFLAAAFLKLYFSKDRFDSKTMFVMAMLISLLALTRMDSVLMFIPMILFVYIWKRDNVSFPKAVLIGIAGLLPFVFWELFSVFYYGFPFPNTFYVKLGTGISRIEYLSKGLEYFSTTLLFDPLVVLIPVFAVLSALISKNNHFRMCSAGVLLYIGYVFSIGGDFMVGRHYTVIFLISVIALLWAYNHGCFTYDYNRILIAVWSGFIILGFLAIIVIRPGVNYEVGSGKGVADERDWYFHSTSLIVNLNSYINDGEMTIDKTYYDIECNIRELEGLGITGAMIDFAPGIAVYDNSEMYLSDSYGLGDPLLSHLPAVREENWRVGHIWRDAPFGYPETIMYGDNVIENDSLNQYYEVIRLITRGPLFDIDRIRAIIDLNIGRYDYLLDDYCSTLDANNFQQVD